MSLWNNWNRKLSLQVNILPKCPHYMPQTCAYGAKNMMVSCKRNVDWIGMIQWKAKRLKSLFLSLYFQVASARFVCRPSEDIPYPQQRWYSLWLANDCCSTDQRSIWRCSACAKYEGWFSICKRKLYFSISSYIFSGNNVVFLIARWRWRLCLSLRRNLFNRTTWRSCSDSQEAPLTQHQAWISPLVACQHQNWKPLMNPWSLRRLATLLSQWWRFAASVLFIWRPTIT